MENSIKGRFVIGRGAAAGAGLVALLLIVAGIVLVSTSRRRMSGVAEAGAAAEVAGARSPYRGSRYRGFQHTGN